MAGLEVEIAAAVSEDADGKAVLLVGATAAGKLLSAAVIETGEKAG